MAVDPLVEARFPEISESAGHYESFYIRAAPPQGGLGFWIRYTVHKRPGAGPKGSVWFTLFDSSADGPRASKVTLPDPGSGPGGEIRVGESRLRPGEAVGAAPTDHCDASWELRFASSEEPLLHLPRRWLYRAPVPRTKLLSPMPAAAFEGALRVDGREIAVEGWRGMMGHNWGSEHAERWVWLHGLFDDGSWLDCAVGRVKVGPATLPWIANGALSLDGARHPLGGPQRARRTEIRESPEGCEFVLPGHDVTVQGKVAAARKDFAGFVYADPDGPEHNTVNCSIADLRVVVSRPGEPQRSYDVSGAAVYELGMRETDHGVEMQPFPDG